MRPGRSVAVTESLDRRVLLSAMDPAALAISSVIDNNSSPAHFETSGDNWPQPGGPGTPAQITFSFSNLLDGQIGDPNVIRSIILEALSLWTAVAPIQFTNVTDSGPAPSGDSYPADSHPHIRFGHYNIDGVGGTRANAYLPSDLGEGLSGDIHFDDSENWTNNPDTGLDLLEYATEQIGRALGLLPSNVSNSIMNSGYGQYFDGQGTGYIFQDDMDGIRSIYGNGFGYVIDNGTLYLGGTEASENFLIQNDGSSLVVERDQFGAAVSLASVTKIIANAHGGADGISFRNLSDLQLEAHGGAGDDHVQLHDDMMPSANTYVVTNGQMTRSGSLNLDYSNDIESVEVWTGPSNDTINILQVSAARFAADNLGGTDVVNLSGAFGVSEILGDVYISVAVGQTNVNVNDTGNSVTRNIIITNDGNHVIDGLTGGKIDLANIGIPSINLITGQGIDTIRVRQLQKNLNINNSGGTDAVIIGDNTTTGSGFDNIRGDIFIQNFSSFTSLILDDTHRASHASNVVWDVDGPDTVITGLSASGSIRYRNSDVSLATVYASMFHDTFTVNNATGRALILGGGGNDTLTFNATDPTSLIEMNGEAGNDVININTDNTGSARVTQVGTDSINMLNLAAGGRLRLSGLGTSLFVNSASLNGILDIGDGAFIRKNFAPNFSYYTDRLRNGYNGGAWNGAQPAILSSTAANTVISGDSVGYGFGNQTITSLGGLPVGSNDMVVRYTLEGDTNLDRVVDFNDLLRVAQNYGLSTRLWSQGNFNFDGAFRVDFNDLLMLAQKYGSTLWSAKVRSSSSTSSPVSRGVLGSNADDALWDD